MDPLNDHPIVQRFHAINLQGPLTEEECQVVSQAYVLHDEYYGKTLDDCLRPYRDAYGGHLSAHNLAQHIRSKLNKEPDLALLLLQNPQQFAENILSSFDPGTGAQANTVAFSVSQALATGQIVDLRSFYQFMIRFHRAEVEAMGW